LRRLTSFTSITRRIALRRLGGGGAHRHVAGHHGDLGLEVDAPGLVGHHRVARADEAVRAALVHQRVGVERGRHLGVARLAHQLDVVDVGRAVGPLVGARQRRGAGGLVEGLGVDRAAVERLVHLAQLRLAGLPVVERGLQAAGDRRHRTAAGEIAADDDQGAVAAALLEGGEFHLNISL
jgi:hypothetical protein